MKPIFRAIYVLTILLFLAVSCVSSPSPVKSEQSAEQPAEQPPELKTEPVTQEIIQTSEAAPTEISAEVIAETSVEPPNDTSPISETVAPDTKPVTQGTQKQAGPSPAPSAPSPSPSPAPSAPSPSTALAGNSEKPKQIGEVVYTEGIVSVHRAGKTKTSIDIGDVVYAYDVMITGKASLAQVDLGSGRPGGASIRLAENTAFYFDTKELSAGQRQTVLQLLSGSIAVKVEKLAGGSFSAVTDTAVLGVRGTEFVIDTIPDGSILVSCIEGLVAIQDSEGQTLSAQPGRTVSGGEAGLSAQTVAFEELAKNRISWRQSNFTNFASLAIKYSSGYAATLESNRGAFDNALAELSKQEAVLSLWREAKTSGRIPRFTEWITEKKTVGGVLFESLKSLFGIERAYYRLLELKTLHESGTGVGVLQDGRSTAEYFGEFDSRYESLADGMARVREALLLFAWASAGSPLGDFFGSKADSLGNGALFLGGGDW